MSGVMEAGMEKGPSGRSGARSGEGWQGTDAEPPQGGRSVTMLYTPDGECGGSG